MRIHMCRLNPIPSITLIFFPINLHVIHVQICITKKSHLARQCLHTNKTRLIWWMKISFFLSFSLSHRRHSSNNIAHTKESVLMKTWVSYHCELVRETLKVVKIERESEENCCETKSKVKQKKGRKHKRKLR